MKRRDFLQAAGAASLALGALPSCTTAAAQEKKIKNWVWLRGISNEKGQKKTDEIKRFFETLKSNHVDGIIPSGSNERYHDLAPLAKEFDLTMHGWRWTMNRGGYMKDHPDWYAVSRNGESVIDKPPYVGYYRWLCPTHPEVKEELIRDYTELARIEGIEAVHFDYVRYCDVILPIALQPKYNLVQDHEMPEYDFCYCERCRGLFKEEHGIDPLDMEDASKSVEWRQFRYDAVVTLVNSIVDAVHAEHKLVSGAVFPTPKIAREVCRQPWDRYNLDMFMPMGYSKDYNEGLEWLADVTKTNAAVMKDHQTFYMGLHLDHCRETGIQKSIETCLENGANGVSFFMESFFTKDEWKQYRAAVEKFI